LSKDQSFLVVHRVDPLRSHPLLAGLPQVSPGFTSFLPTRRSPTTALDYFRAPLFDWPTGVAVPHVGPGTTDDLQDLLILYLQQLQTQHGELFVFGSRFPEPGHPANPRPIDLVFNTTQGVHNIHLNQGNARPGPFAADNGVFQDGGLILKFPTRFVGLFLRFQTQWLPTDNSTGERSPQAQPVPVGSAPSDDGPPTEPPVVAHPPVYIERALVNPAGHDPGKEVVVLGNTTTSPVDLTGWRIVDQNNNAEVLSTLVLPGGESHQMVLSGQRAQLGNKGGTIRLTDASGTQIHAVSYAKADAAPEGRYLRFTT
jgi:uncharacterized protein YukJ